MSKLYYNVHMYNPQTDVQTLSRHKQSQSISRFKAEQQAVINVEILKKQVVINVQCYRKPINETKK